MEILSLSEIANAVGSTVKVDGQINEIARILELSQRVAFLSP